jgi:hypothetical protein
MTALVWLTIGVVGLVIIGLIGWFAVSAARSNNG